MARRATGEGTIYRRRDGRYEAAAYVSMTDGTRRRVRVYGRTRADAAGKLSDLISQDRAGVPEPSTTLTLGEYLDRWLATVAKPAVRPLTFRSYEMYVREHIKPAIGSKRLRQLTAADIRAFLNAERQRTSRSPGNQTQPISAQTIAHVHAVLRNALEHAVRDDLLIRNVARQVKIPTPPVTDRKPLTPDEVAKLLAAAAADTRLYAAVVFCLALGLRRGEVLGLRWHDVDPDLRYAKLPPTGIGSCV